MDTDTDTAPECWACEATPVEYEGDLCSGCTHTHTYDIEISDWWCIECATVTDYCYRY